MKAFNLQISGVTQMDGSINGLVIAPATAPASPIAGHIYYDEIEHKLKGVENNSVVSLASTAELTTVEQNLVSAIGLNVDFSVKTSGGEYGTVVTLTDMVDSALSHANTAKQAADSAQVTADAALPKAGGTMTGDITMQSGTTIVVQQPSSDLQVANKGYVDQVSKGMKWRPTIRSANLIGMAAGPNSTIYF